MWFCYILKTTYQPHKNRTYIGFTNNPVKRLRQHNQEITGGSKYTKMYGNKSWYIYFLITGFPDKISALQCEWRLKHSGKRLYGPAGRICGANLVLKLKQWTSNSIFENDMYDIQIWIQKKYTSLLTNLPENINVTSCDTINLQKIIDDSDS